MPPRPTPEPELSPAPPVQHDSPEQRSAARMRGVLRSCFNAALSRNVDMHGKLSVETTPSPDGCRFKTVRVSSTGSLDRDFANCVRVRLEKIDLCAEGTIITKPMTFSL
jgi:hypothetical protein